MKILPEKKEKKKKSDAFHFFFFKEFKPGDNFISS